MAYAFRYLTAEQQAEIKAQAVRKPAVAAPNEALLRAWESDLAAHQALVAIKTGDEKRPHADAIKVLEAALSKTPQ